jgi:hypothetical protein
MLIKVSATVPKSYSTTTSSKVGIIDDFRYTIINTDHIISMTPVKNEYNYKNPFKGNPDNFIEFPLDLYEELTLIVTVNGNFVVNSPIEDIL